LVRALQRSYPLPLKGVVKNKRSLVALDNLIDLLITCIDHPLAANQTFLVSDGEDLSTSELIIRLGRALNVPAHLFYIPNSILDLSSKLIRREEAYQSLCGTLQVNISKTRQLLGWNPLLTVNEGLKLVSNTIY
jgi:nucleoside-diphosphate-sugar epimerase